MSIIDFNQVYLTPNYSTIRSRDNLDQGLEFLGHCYRNPVIPANMACSIDYKIAKELDENEYFSILHRFYPYEDIFTWIKKNHQNRLVNISVGVKDRDRDLIASISNERLEVHSICIDLAHGHCIAMKEMIGNIKSYLPNTKIIAGNVTTKKACQDLKKWGADAVKVGLSRGAACTTYTTTGVGSGGHFSTLKECCSVDIPIVSDGGIRNIGDISKALVAGANMVMVGSMFVACKDSPAETIKPYVGSDTEYKLYYGSSSAKNKNSNNYVEGSENIWITPNNLTYLELMDKINQGLRSTMSYAGVSNIKDLKKMKYVCK